MRAIRSAAILAEAVGGPRLPNFRVMTSGSDSAISLQMAASGRALSQLCSPHLTQHFIACNIASTVSGAINYPT